MKAAIADQDAKDAEHDRKAAELTQRRVERLKTGGLADGFYRISSCLDGFEDSALGMGPASEITATGNFLMFMNQDAPNHLRWRMRLTRQEDGTYIVSGAPLPGSAMCTDVVGHENSIDYRTYISPHDYENTGRGGKGKWRYRFLKQTDGTYVISSAQYPESAMFTSTSLKDGGHWRIYMSPSDRNHESKGKWRFRVTEVCMGPAAAYH